jgi:protein-S-isoprenylcysteine O-methyltransferase Ste14
MPDPTTTPVLFYGAITGVTWIVFLIVWLALAIVFRDGGRRYESPATRGLRLLLAIAIFIAVRYSASAIPPFGALTRDVAAAGAALCVVGLGFAAWARVALGRNWGMPMTLHEHPELVTSGPYRLVRHPIYTGISAMMIGTALVYPLAALPCLVWIGYVVFSAVREERDMEQRFPGAYLDYKKRSKMLVPFLF